MRILVNIGAIVSLATVATNVLLAQTRIFYMMGNDHLLPIILSNVNRKRKTPVIATSICGEYLQYKTYKEMSMNMNSFLGGFCAILSGLCPVDILGDTASMAALIIFLFVHISVIVVSISKQVKVDSSIDLFDFS